MLHLVRSTARRCGKRDLACSGRAFVNISNLKRPPQEVEDTGKHWWACEAYRHPTNAQSYGILTQGSRLLKARP